MYEDIKAKPFELNFVKTNPGITIEPTEQDLTTTLKQLKKDLGEQLKESTSKSLFSKILGHKSQVTVETDGAKITMDIYEPGWFSRKQPTVNIQPEGKTPKTAKASLNLAATIAATFATPVKSVKATYGYQAADMINPYMEKVRETRGKYTAQLIDSRRNTQKNKLSIY